MISASDLAMMQDAIAELRILAPDAVAVPLIITATVQIKHNGSNVGGPIPAYIKAPSAEQVTADGGNILYDVQIAIGTNVRQNDLMVITDCPSNPAMVAASASGWSISAVRPVGFVIPKTLFRALAKVQ